MTNLSEAVGALTVLDRHGEYVPLAPLWDDTPVVLVLVRHFGCQFCREQVSELRHIVGEIEAAGASLVIVGNGTPLMLDAFIEAFGSGLPHLYTDPQRNVYEALDAKRGRGWFVFDPRIWLNTLRALRRGARQGRTQGDSAQLGGVWVARAGGDVVFEHRSDVAGDHPANDEILAALPRAAAV